MRATSKASFESTSRLWESVLDRAGVRAQRFGEELYAVSDLLAGSTTLQRSLTDPSRSGDDKAALADRILRGKVADEVVDVVQALVRSRWSAAPNLAHAMEVLAVDSILASAEAHRRLETVEDELFRIDRLLVVNRDLRLALSDGELPVDRRTALVESLFEGRVSAETVLFLRRSTATLHARSISSALNAIVQRAAERRHRLVATVISAAPLTEAQVTRLSEILGRAYGRTVQIKEGLDERVVGGLRIQIGSEVVDATMLARLQDARRRLAG